MSLDRRFWAKVSVTPSCWLWTGAPTHEGYGRYRVTKTPERRALAHRYAYEQVIGPITAPTLDHLCRNRLCVRWDHLEAVTRGENTRRGQHPLAVAGRTNVCPQGHSLDNAYLRSNGRRLCRTCNDRRNSERTRP